jgi:hypothetical protein
MKGLKFVTQRFVKSSPFIFAVLLTTVLFPGVGVLVSTVVNLLLLRHFPIPTPDQLDSMLETKPKSILDLVFAILDLVKTAL